MNIFPTLANDLSTDNLTTLVQTIHPSVAVTAFKINKEFVFDNGEEAVSTAGRIEAEVSFSDNQSIDLPTQLIIKVCRPDIAPRPLYRNEVNFYTRLRQELTIEAPVCIGGMFDEETANFGLALEDMRLRGVSFPNVKSDHGVDHIKSVLKCLAKLHAFYWNSPRFKTDLHWLDSHTNGELYTFFNHPDIVPAVIKAEVANEQFKKEMIESLGQTTKNLYQEMRKVQHHQSTLTPTICHGDTHIGNTYALPDGNAGLYDWQLMSRGYFMHDVSYIIITGLSVAERRQYQHELINFYLDQLQQHGVVDAPNVDQAFTEFRYAAVWCLYIGWLTTPIENYGWDITVCNHVRLTNAYRDLDSKAAVALLPEVPPYTD